MSLDFMTFIQTTGYVGLFLLIFAESGLLIGVIVPGGDTLLLTAGVLASQGVLDIRIVVPVCLVATLVGYDVGYVFGRYAGRRLYERGDSRWFRRAHLVQAEAFFVRFGGNAIVPARFFPVVRTFMPIAAGMAAIAYPRFAVLNAVGAILWGGGVVWVGYLLGDHILTAVQQFVGTGRGLWVIVIVAVIALAGAVIYAIRRKGQGYGGDQKR